MIDVRGIEESSPYSQRLTLKKNMFTSFWDWSHGLKKGSSVNEESVPL